MPQGSPAQEAASYPGPLGLPGMRARRWWARMWRPFWVLPLVICLAAWLAGVVLPLLDAAATEELPYVFQGGPDGARSLLSTIASAMISVTGLVFSITMVVLQLASSQFTPRVLDTFLRSRVTQVTLGVFTASFIFALTVLRSVRGGYQGADPFVPQLSVTVAFVLVLASVGMFLAFIRHITTSIQVSQIITRLGNQTVDVASKYFPLPDDTRSGALHWSPPPGASCTPVIARASHGHVTQVDHQTLLQVARKLEAVIEVSVPVGRFVVEDAVVAAVWGTQTVGEDDLCDVRDAIVLEADRAPGQDPAFGIRRLVDIADRALSPGINDPTTGTQVLDQLHRVLRVLVQRRTPPSVLADGDAVRLVHRPQRIPELLTLAVEEIAHYGRDTIQVPQRIRALLTDLLPLALPEYRPALQGWLAAVPEPVRRKARP